MEIFIRVLESIFFKNQLENIEPSITTLKLKNSINGSSNRSNIAAERISELEDRSEENIRIYIFF